uniref:2Fe-2S ferredoxin-type domain-containing protein n=2 Tax=Tetradesmus obliquus TaxID=3088 RepID=A0A383VEF3_TETOB|eukprot:jgi/Sobl393_1/17730/SZX63112.1
MIAGRSLQSSPHRNANVHVARHSSSNCSRRLRVCVQASSEPTITVKFVEEGQQPVTIECISGEEQLRAAMLDNKVDLYTTWGKLWQCGGGGQCGTCIVQVQEGAELLSERTATEDKKLNKKPETWRLACQTIVGDGTNSGTVVIQTKPQK